MRAFAVLALLAVSATTVAGCGGSSHHSAAKATAAATGTSAATRFWDNGAEPAGSTIDPAHPTLAAADLHSDRTTYCHVLSSTLAAGHSVLGGVKAGDPSLATTTQAWLADIRAVAPSALASDWQTVSNALLALIEPSTSSTKPAASSVSAASQAIAADAKASCSLELAPTK